MSKKILIAVPTFENIKPECFKSIYALTRPEGYDLYFADFDLSFGYVGSFLVAILVCFVMQLFINRNPMLNNTKSGMTTLADIT